MNTTNRTHSNNSNKEVIQPNGYNNVEGWSLVGLYILIPTLISLLGMSIGGSNSSTMAICTFFGYALYLLLALVVSPSLRECLVKTFKGEEESKIKRYIIYMVVAFFSYYILNFIINLMMGGIYMATNNKSSVWDYWQRVPGQNQQNVVDMILSIPWLGFFSIVILAPIVEESVFRFAFFKLNKNPKVAIVISGLLFACVHMLASIGHLEDMWYTTTYVIIGFVLAYTYYKTDEGIDYTIGIHTGINLVSYIVLMSTN